MSELIDVEREVSRTIGKRIAQVVCWNTIALGDYYAVAMFFDDGSSLKIQYAPFDGYVLKAEFVAPPIKEVTE